VTPLDKAADTANTVPNSTSLDIVTAQGLLPCRYPHAAVGALASGHQGQAEPTGANGELTANDNKNDLVTADLDEQSSLRFAPVPSLAPDVAERR
jgi:hypothetical protein